MAKSTLHPWWIAVRPHTLPAAASPVLMGVGLAIRDGILAPSLAAAALLGALLIQIATNFANDYFDAQSGVDAERSGGFTRVTQSGLLTPSTVLRAMIATFALAVIGPGLWLVYWGGVPILVIGLLGVACGITYAGGPIPFGSIGLGDLMVFVFFGLIAVTGTYYVQAAYWLATPFPLLPPPGTIPAYVWLASLPAAGLTTAILVVNNVRDLQTDRRAGKYTLAVWIGYSGSRIEYTLMLGIAYAVPAVLWIQWNFSTPVLLPLLTLPFSIPPLRTVWSLSGDEPLNRALSATGKLLLGYALLFALGVSF